MQLGILSAAIRASSTTGQAAAGLGWWWQVVSMHACTWLAAAALRLFGSVACWPHQAMSISRAAGERAESTFRAAMEGVGSGEVVAIPAVGGQLDR